jgi:putative Holliday junction resolvase
LTNISAGSLLGLDFGSRRVGVAVASLTARLPRPLVTLTNDEKFFDALERYVKEESVVGLVVGLPRSLDSEATPQTRAAEQFSAELLTRFKLPVYPQDEALTSRMAEAELAKKGDYQKEDVDALAAAYILDDFLREPPKEFKNA